MLTNLTQKIYIEEEFQLRNFYRKEEKIKK